MIVRAVQRPAHQSAHQSIGRAKNQRQAEKQGRMVLPFAFCLLPFAFSSQAGFGFDNELMDRAHVADQLFEHLRQQRLRAI